nr:integrase, catalytic region, zinc finger, CCHC-type, peptidase aspartic, catalytic [Tanacetum cinerariifolium]
MRCSGFFVEHRDFCLRKDESRRDYGWFDNADSVVIQRMVINHYLLLLKCPLKDPKFWTAEEKKTRKIDRLARSFLIQWLSNDIYSLIDSNKTAKDLWDALERQMRGFEYGEQDREAAILYKYETFKAIEERSCLILIFYDTLMRQTKNLMDINIDALYNILKQNQGGVHDALEYKKKAVVVTSDPLALSDDKKVEKKADEKKRDMCKVKCYNCKKEGHFAKDCKKAKVKDYNYYKINTLLAKKDSDEQVLLTEDQAWMESDKSSSSAEETIAEVAFYTSESESESEFETLEYYDKSTNYDLFVNNDDDQDIFHDVIESASENFIENHIDSQKDYDKSEVDHNDSEEKEHLVDKLIQKFNHKIAKLNTFEEQNNEFNEQIKVLNEKNADLLDQTNILQDQLKVKHVVIDTHTECQAQYAKLEEERYEYMIRYSALCDNDKQHRKKINEQDILFDKMSRQLVEMNNNMLRLQEKILEKETKISELEGRVSNKDVEIEKCLERLKECENKLHKIGQTNQTIHMIMLSKDTLYNGKKGIGFENPSYFEKAKDLRPSLYDEKVIGLGYTLMFLIYLDEALEIEKFKRARENKIEFAYDYGNLNASYQTSLLKPYVPNVILENIIIDLEDEVVSLLEKEKANLKRIESLKSKGLESSENAIYESENQSENDCHVVKKVCDKVENSKVIAPGMFKLSVSQSVLPISMSKTSCESNNVENLLSCNNSHLGETSSAYVCNDAMSVSCNSRICDLFDDNNFFIFDYESVRISPVSKMPFRKKLHDSMNICLWINDSGCSKHMTGNHALLTNFVEKFLGTVRFGNNDFAVIAGYGDVVIESMTIKK